MMQFATLPTKSEIKRFKEFMQTEKTNVYFIDMNAYTTAADIRIAVKEMISWCEQQTSKGDKVLIVARPYDEYEVLTEK